MPQEAVDRDRKAIKVVRFEKWLHLLSKWWKVHFFSIIQNFDKTFLHFCLVPYWKVLIFACFFPPCQENNSILRAIMSTKRCYSNYKPFYICGRNFFSYFLLGLDYISIRQGPEYEKVTTRSIYPRVGYTLANLCTKISY